MSIERVKEQLPAYAKDIRLNLDSLLMGEGVAGMEPSTRMAVALACAATLGQPLLLRAIEEEASAHLDEDQCKGAFVAAAMMGMTNIYYRFVHLCENEEYATMRAGLRMQAMATPGLAKKDFELASLAVSAITGCGMCMASHEKLLRQQHGIGAEVIQGAVRIAAVLHAAAKVLSIEEARQAA